MPSDKRARKRAARDAKLAALQRAQRRRSTVRRTITVVVLVAVAAGIYALVSGGSTEEHRRQEGRHHTTSSTPPARRRATTTTTLSAAQVAADQAAVAAGCPSNPSTPLNKPTYKSAPAMTIDTTKTYTATVKTDVGTFVITLDAKDAPVTVNSFVFLAQQHFFNCVTFMRVIPGFVVQGGSPNQSNGHGLGPRLRVRQRNASPRGSSTRWARWPWPTRAPTPTAVSSSSSWVRTQSRLLAVRAGDLGHERRPPDQRDGQPAGHHVTHRMLSVTIAES